MDGFAELIDLLLNRFQLDPEPQPSDPTPLLQPHYRAFYARTGWSAPVPRIGTLTLVVQPLGFLPCHRDDWFPQFRMKARTRFMPPLRRMPPAQHSGRPQAYPRLTTPAWFRHRFLLYDASSVVRFRSSP